MQAFVYLSGRGVQYEGDNFFVPIDAQIARDADVPIEAVRIADFEHALAAEPGQARILVLDAARANPYAHDGSPLAGGLALVEPDAGVIMAFNAAPGSVAGDEAGPYGIYAKTLAGAMREGGLPIDDVFAQTRVGVNESTGGAQIPWNASKLTAPYFVFERAADAAQRPIRGFSAQEAYAAAVERDSLAGYEEFLAAYPTGAQAKRVRAILAARREALFWRRAALEDSPRAYWTYLRRYPDGPHVWDAERRLAILSARNEPPADFAPEGYADLPPPPPDELAYADQPVFLFSGERFGPPPPPPPYGFVAEEGDDWRDLPPPPPPTEIGVLPVLGVAIPLIATARPYRDAGRHEGRAAPGAPPPVAQAPATPPPLPGGVKPRPATPSAGAVKPTPAPTPAPTPSKASSATPIPTPTPTLPPSAAPLKPVQAPPTLTPTPLKVLKATPPPTPTPSAAPLKPVQAPPTLTPTPLKVLKATPPPTPTPSAAPLKPLQAPPAPTPMPLKDLKPIPTPTPTKALAPAPELKVAPPAPVVHAPAPVVHAPPPPPVVHAAPPPPVVHAAPPPDVHAPAKPQEKKKCGKPGLPPCPK
jgi:uncharacterized caspase-like protein